MTFLPPIDMNQVKGFLDPLEGEALYSYAKKYVINKPALEIGSYCGNQPCTLVKELKRIIKNCIL